MKLTREEYREAKGCLKRYNYNCIKIINIRADIISIGSPSLDGMPKAPYSISDRVFNSVVRLQEDKDLQNTLKEYKAVTQALELVSEDSKTIFNKQYQLGQTKWEIVAEGMSEGTYNRRHSELVYAVYKEIKKWEESEKLLTKNRAIMVVGSSRVRSKTNPLLYKWC